MKPKISVVMAVYNGGQYIGEQLKSILCQTRPIDELILLEDNSPEKCLDEIRSVVTELGMSEFKDDIDQAGAKSASGNSAENGDRSEFGDNASQTGAKSASELTTDGNNLLSNRHSWKSDNCTVHYYEHSEQKGYAQTFFDALSLTTGDFIFFSDQDDIWEKNKVAVGLSVLKKHPEILCLSSCNRLIDGESKIFGQDRRPRKQLSPIDAANLIMQKHGALRPGMTTVIRRSLKQTIDKMDVSGYEMHDRLIEYLAAIKGGYWLLGEYLSRYRIHDANTSGMNLSHTKLRTGLDGRIDQIDKEVRYLDQIYDIAPEYRQTIDRARNYFSSRRKLLLNKNVIKYVVCSPRLFGRYSGKKVWLGDIAGIIKG